MIDDNMFLAYLDDSKDDNAAVYSAILIHSVEWLSLFNEVKNYRKHLNSKYGIYISKELHAWKFVSGRGNISKRVVTKTERSQIFQQTLGFVSSQPLRIFNAISSKKEELKGLEYLMNRINRTCEVKKENCLLICDEGKEYEITKLKRRLNAINYIPSKMGVWTDTGERRKNITIDRIIEDPFFKQSDKSYLIQLADFCAYSLLRREYPTQKTIQYGLEKAFEILEPVLAKEATRKDPMGIIRV